MDEMNNDLQYNQKNRRKLVLMVIFSFDEKIFRK